MVRWWVGARLAQRAEYPYLQFGTWDKKCGNLHSLFFLLFMIKVGRTSNSYRCEIGSTIESRLYLAQHRNPEGSDDVEAMFEDTSWKDLETDNSQFHTVVQNSIPIREVFG